MKTLLEAFKHATQRAYKDGTEIRVKNLDEGLGKARNIIKQNNLSIEIFDISAELRSFAVRAIAETKTA